MACELLVDCIFFNDKMSDMPSMSDMLKERYCKGEWRACARYRVFAEVGRDDIPTDLYPAQADRVQPAIEAVHR